jgi:hypothetical protein
VEIVLVVISMDDDGPEPRLPGGEPGEKPAVV